MAADDGERAGRWLVARHVGQFALAGVVTVVIVGYATSVASRRVGEREAISEARTTTLIKAEGLVEPALTDAFADENDPATAARLQRILTDEVIDSSLVRVKIWSSRGVVLASDETRLVGRQFDLDADEADDLVSGRIEAEVSGLDEPENVYERELGTKLLEVYLPVHTPNGEPLLFEAYYVYDSVRSNGSRLWRSFAPISLGALAMLLVVQIPLVWSLARRLQLRLAEREQLLQRALDASAVERRQIASDLHDGVVQDLAGVGYALAARARPVGAPADAEVAALAATVQDSIRELRSLVVDLSPPDLREEGLVPTLTDLVDRTRTPSLAVHLDVSGDADRVADSSARLIVRAAQEALRNVGRHAGASQATLRLDVDAHVATLTVRDDGVGFDVATLPERARDGHAGLRTLRGVVGDGGGHLTVTSQPGAGTTVTVDVPV